MSQRLATAVQHPLASAASLTPPQLPLGDETPRNDEELPLGDETPGTTGRAAPAGKRSVIDAAPDSLGGRYPEDQFAGESGNIGLPSSPWGKKPQGSICWRERQHWPPQLPLGDETPRINSLAIVATSAAPASLGGRNPEEQPSGERGNIGLPSFPWRKKPRGKIQRRASLGGRNPEEKSRASLGGQNPGDKNNGNAQPSRLRSKKRNDKDDSQPPRLRQTKQASPLGCNLYVLFMFSPTTLNVVRKKAGTGGSELSDAV